MLISEMVPVDQSADNRTEMVRIQIFYRLKSTPGQFKSKWTRHVPTYVQELPRDQSLTAQKTATLS
jgi:hypothetical protein